MIVLIPYINLLNLSWITKKKKKKKKKKKSIFDKYGAFKSVSHVYLNKDTPLI